MFRYMYSEYCLCVLFYCHRASIQLQWIWYIIKFLQIQNQYNRTEIKQQWKIIKHKMIKYHCLTSNIKSWLWNLQFKINPLAPNNEHVAKQGAKLLSYDEANAWVNFSHFCTILSVFYLPPLIRQVYLCKNIKFSNSNPWILQITPGI
jgi:hypothetical protein